jgi:hypothetical protein
MQLHQISRVCTLQLRIINQEILETTDPEKGRLGNKFGQKVKN